MKSGIQLQRDNTTRRIAGFTQAYLLILEKPHPADARVRLKRTLKKDYSDNLFLKFFEVVRSWDGQ